MDDPHREASVQGAVELMTTWLATPTVHPTKSSKPSSRALALHLAAGALA
jgi:hypothetical protein